MTPRRKVPAAVTPGVRTAVAPGLAGAIALTLVAAAAGTASLAPGSLAAQQPSLEAARAHALAGRWDASLAAFEALARAGGRSGVGGAAPVAAREHAGVLLTLARYEDALARVSGPDGAATPELENVRGEALYALGRIDEAEAAFRAAWEAGAADRITARKNLAVLLWMRGDRERALELFDSFIGLYNRGAARTAEDLLAVGTAVRHLGVTNPALFRDALKAYDEAAAAGGAGHRPDLLVGELFLEKYTAPEAHAAFDRVLAANPRHPRALLGKARVLEFDGEGEGALERVREALEIAPADPDARAFLGRLHLATEEYDVARRAAERALETNPAHLEALSVLAAAHWFREDTVAYRSVRDRAMALHPGYAGFFVTLAEIAERHRRYHDAVDLAAEAVRRDDHSPRALGVLGMNELRIGRIEEGRNHLDRAFELDPYNPWYKNSLDLLDTFGEYETVRTEHFELFLHGSEAALLGPLAAELAEEAYAALAARYGAEPPLPVRVEIFPSHADFSVRTLGLVGLGALGVSFGSTLVMDSPSARDPGDFNWASTLWHELAHAFHLGMTGHRVPRWFSEGLSVREQRLARERWGMGPTPGWLQSYRAGRMPPVSRLNEAFVRPAYPGQVVHGYYQASLVFDMIEERWGFRAVREMLQGYRDGATTDALVRDVLETTPDALDEHFDRWVRDRFGDRMAAVEPLVGGGGLLPGIGGGDRPGEGGGGAGRGAAGGASGGGASGATDLDGLRRAARRSPGSYQARLALGRALYDAGRLDEAEGELRAALRLFPEYGGPDGPLWWLARIHEDRGETERAAAALHALGRLGDSLWEVHAREGRLLLEVGDTAAAVPALEKATEVVPFDADLHRLLAEAYAAVGDAAGEVRERTALLALDPADRAEALYLLARAHRRAGDAGAARSRVLAALEIAPSYDAALELLLELREGGR